MKSEKVGQVSETTRKTGLSARKLISEEAVEAVHVEITPGGTLPSHVTPVNVFFYVLEGEGEIEIGSGREPVIRDMLVASPKGIPHALHNRGELPFRVLVVKTPRPV